MTNFFKKINVRNIQDLYALKGVNENGEIELKSKNVTIYKVDPANIISCDNETKYKIYQAYLTCIRGLPNSFQIVISKNKKDFDSQINEYKNKLKKTNNEGLKTALKKYIEYLETISTVNTLYQTSQYLIVQNIKQIEQDEIINFFSNLKEFGVRIERIKSKSEVENVIRNCVLKDETKWI